VFRRDFAELVLAIFEPLESQCGFALASFQKEIQAMSGAQDTALLTSDKA
jgi:hypothetical protein